MQAHHVKALCEKKNLEPQDRQTWQSISWLRHSELGIYVPGHFFHVEILFYSLAHSLQDNLFDDQLTSNCEIVTQDDSLNQRISLWKSSKHSPRWRVSGKSLHMSRLFAWQSVSWLKYFKYHIMTIHPISSMQGPISSMQVHEALCQLSEPRTGLTIAFHVKW